MLNEIQAPMNHFTPTSMPAPPMQFTPSYNPNVMVHHAYHHSTQADFVPSPPTFFSNSDSQMKS